LALLLLFWQWRAMPAVIWHVEEPEIAMLIATLSFVAWVVVVISAFLIAQSEPVGRYRVANGRADLQMPTIAPFHHRLLRRPIYPAIIVAFWAAPTMSVGHLLLAAAATAYILFAIMLEGRNLIGAIGNE
jgi:protein-S-isoprenylcysteine O-methyltransferase Ste14